MRTDITGEHLCLSLHIGWLFVEIFLVSTDSWPFVKVDDSGDGGMHCDNRWRVE